MNGLNWLSDFNIPGRHLYKPIVSDNIQTRRFLSGSARSTSAVAVPK